MCEARLRLRQLARKVIARMQGDLSHAVFDAWAEYVRGEVGRRYELRRTAINRMRAAVLTQCYEAWATVVGAEARRQETMRPFIKLLRNRLATSVFNGWRDAVAAAAGLRHRFAARIANTLLAKVGSQAEDACVHAHAHAHSTFHTRMLIPSRRSSSAGRPSRRRRMRRSERSGASPRPP